MAIKFLSNYIPEIEMKNKFGWRFIKNLVLISFLSSTFINAQVNEKIDKLIAGWEKDLIEIRRDIHQHPELGNREFRTSKIIADQLRSYGIDVREKVAHTGVVGVLEGGLPGPVIAFRADMDALPVTEMVDLLFASKEKAEYNGAEVGVMHACGHDAHVTILLGLARTLAAIKDEIPGTVKFIFQPAEEGAPAGEEGGAYLMIKEGALENPKPEAIFGLHVFPYTTGKIAYSDGATMASADVVKIKVKGKQTHGAVPWGGVDPIVIASQIVLGVQTIISRQINLTTAPSIISFGSIHGGVRNNIIPGEVELVGTMRTLDSNVRKEIKEKIKRTAEKIAESSGGSAEVAFEEGYPVTKNDSKLLEKMLPVLKQSVGEGNIFKTPPQTVAEDFSYYAEKIPGLYFFLGVTPPDKDPATVAMNHSPYFFVDENALKIGVRTLANLALAYLGHVK